MPRLLSTRVSRPLPGFNIVINSAPATDPVSTAEVEDWLGLDSGDGGTKLDNLIDAATTMIERYTGRALITQTLELHADNFPGQDIPWWDGVREISRAAFNRLNYLELPRPPLQSVSSVVYRDLDDSDQTFATGNYVVDTAREPGRIILKQGKTWPSDVRTVSGVKVTYIAGYGAGASSVPEDLRTAILQTLSRYWNHPDTDIQSEQIGNASQTLGSELTGGAGVAHMLPPTARAIADRYRIRYL